MQEVLYTLKEYLSPELVFMIPLLMVVGAFLKKSNKISSSNIPNVLCALGIPLALLISFTNQYEPLTIQRIVLIVLMSIGQGVFLGLISVGVHQLLKQNKERANLKKWEDEKEEEKTRKELKLELLEELKREMTEEKPKRGRKSKKDKENESESG